MTRRYWSPAFPGTTCSLALLRQLLAGSLRRTTDKLCLKLSPSGVRSFWRTLCLCPPGPCVRIFTRQIADRPQREYPNCYDLNVSHETIYSTLSAMPRGELRRELMALLRQGHVHRWPRSRGVNRKEAGFISEDVLLSVRPPEVEDSLSGKPPPVRCQCFIAQ